MLTARVPGTLQAMRTRIIGAVLAALLGPVALVAPTASPAAADPPPICRVIDCTRPPVELCTPMPDCLPPLSPTLPPLYFTVLGDSYTSGEGASRHGRYVGNPDGTEDWRHRSGYSPVHVAWAYLELGRRPVGSMTIFPTELRTSWGSDRLYFNASSGAETMHLKEEQLDGNVVRNPPQLNDIPTDSHITYFGLGGNDAGFGSLMGTALTSYYINHIRAPLNWRELQRDAVHLEVQRLLHRIPEVSANVEQGLLDTREATPTADIVVALYPIGVKPSGNASLKQLDGQAMDLIHPYAQAVNAAIRAAVDRFKARFPDAKVHIFDPNTAGLDPATNRPNGTSVVAGHELGTASSYFNGVKYRNDQFGQLNFFKAHQESFHPNELGGVAIGKALAVWLADKLPHLFPDGPNFGAVHTDAQASVEDPAAEAAAEEWAAAHPDQLCTGADLASVCWYIGPDGFVTIPLWQWMNPIKLKLLPGAPVPGGGGSPGGPPGLPDPISNPGVYLPGIPEPRIPSPCEIFKTLPPYQAGPSTRVQVAPGEPPVLIDELVMAPKCPWE